MRTKESVLFDIGERKKDIQRTADALRDNQQYHALYTESMVRLQEELKAIEDKERPPKEFWANEYSFSPLPSFHATEELAREKASKGALRVAVLYREVKE